MPLLWQYRHWFLPYAWQYFWGVLMLVLTNVLAASLPLLIKQAIDRLQHHKSPAEGLPIEGLLVLTLVCAIFMMLIRVLSRVYLLGVGRQVEYDVKNRMFEHLLAMPAWFFQRFSPGEVMSRLTSDVQAIRYLAGGSVMLGMNTLLAYATTIPVMLSISPRLTGFALLLYPAAIAGMTFFSRRVKQSFQQVQAVMGQISETVSDNLLGMQTVQSYAKEAVENQRMAKAGQAYFEAYQRLIYARVGLTTLVSVLGGASLLVVLAEGGHELQQGVLQVSGFSAFTLCLLRLAWPTTTMGWTLTIIQQGLGALERLHELLQQAPSDLPDQALSAKTADAMQPQPQGLATLELRDLRFTYEQSSKQPNKQLNEPSKPVLQGISLQFPPKSRIAIVGPLGSGKSTLLKLLSRVWEPPAGSIFLNGQDITTVSLKALRRAVVLMPQHSVLFSDTVRHNMAYAVPEMHLDGIIPFSDQATLHSDILHMPEQYDTLIGERGFTLSGGQRQRVAWVRAFLAAQKKPDAHPSVLLLDDPLSHVDSETEARLLGMLFTLPPDLLTLIVTHRLSVAERADWVLVMNEGHLVAQGTHSQLLKTCLLYQQLHQTQTRTEARRQALEVSLGASLEHGVSP